MNSRLMYRGCSKFYVSHLHLQSNIIVELSLEVKGSLRESQVPVLYGMRPAFRGIEYAGIEQLEQAVFIGKAPLGFGQFFALDIT